MSSAAPRAVSHPYPLRTGEERADQPAERGCPHLGLAARIAALCVKVDRPVDVVEQLVEQHLAGDLARTAVAGEVAVEQLGQHAPLDDESLEALGGLVGAAEAVEPVGHDRRPGDR